jgi:3-hydroxy-9,10-secoandrosta-1,3,5(10)-triene-9,17-dione monooxygenase reductase component
MTQTTGCRSPVREFDDSELRHVMGHFCSGVVVVTSALDCRPLGMTIQAFTSLSLDPPMVSISPALTSTSWPSIRAAGVFCANILASTQQNLSQQFAVSGGDKFAGVPWRRSALGMPRIDGALAWVDCAIEAEYAGGDHSVVIARVLDLTSTQSCGRPLLFFRGQYRSIDD